ncbi:hypothetical protein HD806DRAFT_533337 [Xylariaceae sp. AK1471]|nr:hypothetical protein HD806DRAFT_533337 [Xylariaceae sp. AK1471]
MDPSDKTTRALPSAPVSFDSVATADESTSPDNPRIADHESDSIATADESTPHKDPRQTYYESKDKMTFSSGPLESRYGDITENYDKLTDKIQDLAGTGFQPTPWDKLKADDQRKLNSWTPHAKRFIESWRGYTAILEAWIWRILYEGVFSANPQTKWRNHDNSFEAVKYLGQFIASIEEPQDAADDVRTGPTSVKKYHPVCYTSEWNKLRSTSAELALRKSRNSRTMDPENVVKLIKSNLGYLMKPEDDLGKLADCLLDVSWLATHIDTVMFISRRQPRLVWTDPLEQNEHSSWYGFPLDNKVDPEREAICGLYLDGTRLEHRMRPKWDISFRNFSVLEAASQGENVQLVVRPGVVTRGRPLQEEWVFEGSRKEIYFAGDWKMISWVRPMFVMISESFDPPIKQAMIFDGEFMPAS